MFRSLSACVAAIALTIAAAGAVDAQAPKPVAPVKPVATPSPAPTPMDVTAGCFPVDFANMNVPDANGKMCYMYVTPAMRALLHLPPNVIYLIVRP